MAIVTLADVKAFLNISSDAYDCQLNNLILGASAFIETETARKFDQVSRTDYYDGNGCLDICLRQRPVSTVTSVNLDPTGYYGQASGAFATSTLLTAGTDYILKRDDQQSMPTSSSDTTTLTYSKSGLLRWLGTGTSAYTGLLNRSPSGFLSGAVKGGGWPIGLGNIKVVYLAGWLPAYIPQDLKEAAMCLIREMRRENMYAIQGMILSESIGPYSATYGQIQRLASSINAPSGTSMASILRHYRECAL